MTAPNPYARWEYREDRLELKRWLQAPRRGYDVDVDQVRGKVTLKVWRVVIRREHYTGRREVVFQRRYDACFTIDAIELMGGRRLSTWRSVVAWRLRECRAYLRRHDS